MELRGSEDSLRSYKSCLAKLGRSVWHRLSVGLKYIVVFRYRYSSIARCYIYRDAELFSLVVINF